MTKKQYDKILKMLQNYVICVREAEDCQTEYNYENEREAKNKLLEELKKYVVE